MCVAVPLSQGRCPVALSFSFLIPAGPSGLICTPGPVGTASWRVSEGSPGAPSVPPPGECRGSPGAPSVPPPGECQGEVLGGQRGSPSTAASSLPAGAASTAHRWADAAAAPAAQQAPAGQSRARRWQSGAHPGWRPGRKLAALGRGPLVGCFETGQGHPGLPCCLERRSCEIHLRGLGELGERCSLQVPGR